MSSRISNPGRDLEWWVIIWDALSIRAPRYSITPVTRVTGDCDAPGIMGICQTLRIFQHKYISTIEYNNTPPYISIQSSVQTRAAGVGKCPNNTWFIMQWKSIDEACELCNTVGPGAESWASPDPNSRPYCLLHCSALWPRLPRICWAKWGLISWAATIPPSLASLRWGQAPSRVTASDIKVAQYIQMTLTPSSSSSVSRIAYQGSSPCHTEANQDPPWSMMSCRVITRK